MLVKIDRKTPTNCNMCVLCNENGLCLAKDSTFFHGYDTKPDWCPILDKETPKETAEETKEPKNKK